VPNERQCASRDNHEMKHLRDSPLSVREPLIHRHPLASGACGACGAAEPAASAGVTSLAGFPSVPVMSRAPGGRPVSAGAC